MNEWFSDETESLDSNDTFFLDNLCYPLFISSEERQILMSLYSDGDFMSGADMYYTVHDLCDQFLISGYETYYLFRNWFRRKQNRENKIAIVKRSQKALKEECILTMSKQCIDQKNSDVRRIFDFVRSNKYIIDPAIFKVECDFFIELRGTNNPLFQEFVSSCKRIKAYRVSRFDKFRATKIDNARIRNGHKILLYGLRSKNVYKKVSGDI